MTRTGCPRRAGVHFVASGPDPIASGPGGRPVSGVTTLPRQLVRSVRPASECVADLREPRMTIVARWSPLVLPVASRAVARRAGAAESVVFALAAGSGTAPALRHSRGAAL